MSKKDWNPLIGLGFASLGVGYLWEAFKGPPKDGAVNGLGKVDDRVKPVNGIKSMKMYPAGDITQRENYILNQIRKDSQDPRIISAARAVLAGKCPVERGGVRWCVQPKDWDGEVRALYDAVVNPNSPLAVRYTRDHLTVDLFASSALMQRLPAEDCDGMAIRLGSLLRSVGYHVKTRVVAPKGAPGQWSHIYLMVATPPGTVDQWKPLDPTEPEKTRARARQYPYWEIESAYVDSKRRDREV